MNTARISKLPVWKTVKESYKLAWIYRREYLKISWCWLEIAAPVLFLYNFLAWPFISELSCLDAKQLHEYYKLHPSRADFVNIPSEIFYLFFGASIAVAWHRLVLRHENIARGYYLRLDKVVWNYLIWGIGILLLEKLPELLKMVMANIAGGDIAFVGFGVFLASMLISTRISIILPAIALENNISIKDVWQKTKSNFWRIFIGQLLCMIGIAPCFTLHTVFSIFIAKMK